MRLRQVALASRQLDEVAAALAAVFGLKVAYNDPHIHHYGLRNAVLSAGTGFLEIVEPVRADASAGRFIDRRGGDAGYMVILQAADAEAERARVTGLGVRVVDDLDSRDYRASHFHPADFGGVLTSIDQQRSAPDYLEPYGDWMPAGPDWRDARTADVLDLAAVTILSADAPALAARWATLLGTPPSAADPLVLPLKHGEIRFEPAAAGAPTLVAAITLKVADPAEIRRRALAAGVVGSDGAIRIGGVRFDISG